MERVSVIEGNAPLLFIAPHGADDTHTALLTRKLAESLDAFAVINNGWQRADEYDYYKDKANCNNVAHLMEDVVKDEVLAPIIEYATRIRNEHDQADIFIMHGMITPKDVSLDIVVGFGDGSKPSHSCDIWRKNGLLYLLDENNFDAFAAKPGSKYGGHSKMNLNQFFRKHQHEPDIHSMQIEITSDLRNDREMSIYTAEQLMPVFDDYIQLVESVRDFGKAPKKFDQNWQDIGSKRPVY